MTNAAPVQSPSSSILRRDELTHRGNLIGTRYGWLRLTPAYSVHLVESMILQIAGESLNVLDPFCGTGTTALACAQRGLAATTVDINPFLVWLAGAKCANYSPEIINAAKVGADSVASAILDVKAGRCWIPNLHQIDKWWDASTLNAISRAAARIEQLGPIGRSPAADLLRVVFCQIMIGSAHVSFGHQSMSFRRKSVEAELFPSEPEMDLAQRWRTAARDVLNSAALPLEPVPRVLLGDARSLGELFARPKFDLVITSPPYPNRMSYIRELRPYMYWLGFLSDGAAAGELDWRAIGGTWGSATSRLGEWKQADSLRQFPELLSLCDGIRARSGILATYIERYFADMQQHCMGLAQVVRPGGIVRYIVGNSKFYEHVLPVEQLFAKLFSLSGFSDIQIRRLRKRTSKKELYEFEVSARR